MIELKLEPEEVFLIIYGMKRISENLEDQSGKNRFRYIYRNISLQAKCQISEEEMERTTKNLLDQASLHRGRKAKDEAAKQGDR